MTFSCPSHQPRATDIDRRHSRRASNLIKPPAMGCATWLCFLESERRQPPGWPGPDPGSSALSVIFSADHGELVANFPRELLSGEAGALLSLTPWNAICPNEAAGSLARGSSALALTTHSISVQERLLADGLVAPSQASCRGREPGPLREWGTFRWWHSAPGLASCPSALAPPACQPPTTRGSWCLRTQQVSGASVVPHSPFYRQANSSVAWGPNLPQFPRR